MVNLNPESPHFLYTPWRAPCLLLAYLQAEKVLYVLRVRRIELTTPLFFHSHRKGKLSLSAADLPSTAVLLYSFVSNPIASPPPLLHSSSSDDQCQKCL